jgi:hypothetical protein
LSAFFTITSFYRYLHRVQFLFGAINRRLNRTNR